MLFVEVKWIDFDELCRSWKWPLTMLDPSAFSVEDPTDCTVDVSRRELKLFCIGPTRLLPEVTGRPRFHLPFTVEELACGRIGGVVCIARNNGRFNDEGRVALS